MAAKLTPEKRWSGKQVPETKLSEKSVQPQSILQSVAITPLPESLPGSAEHHAAGFVNQLGAGL
jgi:hypothetical protein